MLHACEIVVQKGTELLIDDVSMSLIGGEVVGLLGPSGSGKSTLLHTLAGDIRPDKGDVWMAGKSQQAWSLGERAVRRAVLEQHTDVAYGLRAEQVVAMGRIPHGESPEIGEDGAIASAALAWVEAGHIADRPYPTLSRGERRQVHMARVLAQLWGRAAHGDCYYFLDEPTYGLDMRHQQSILNVARQVASEGAAVLVVLHDVNLAAMFCDRLVLLNRGRILADGSPKEVLTPPTLRRAFGVEVAVIDHPKRKCPVVLQA